jgi:hypothetical protein
MAKPAAIAEGQIWLDGRTYRIDGQVQRELATRFAPKTVIGDYTDESNPLISTATWRSWNGGFGLETVRSADDFDRHRWSSLYTRLPNHLLLGPSIRQFGGGIGSFLTKYFDFDDELYAVDGIRVHVYDDANDSFGIAPIHVLSTDVTDATTGVLNGEPVTVITQGSATDWSANPGDSAAWNRDLTAMTRVTFWRDLLWGTDTADQLFFTHDLNDGWTQVAELPETSSDVVNIFAGPSGDNGEPEALYLATRRGLWVYDNLGERFRSTGITMPRSNAAATAWNGSVYYSNEQRVFRFTPGPTNVVDDITPGLVSDGATPASLIGPYKEAHPGIDGVFFLTVGQPYVHQWDGHAWSSLPADGNGAFTAGDNMGGMFVSTANGKHRLVYGHLEPFSTNGTARINLPVLSTDLAGQSSLGFMTSGRLFTPWFDGFVSGRDKLAVSLGLEVSIPDSAETLRVSYSKDDGTKSGLVLELNEPGYHAINVPITNENGDPAGVLFDRISLVVEMEIDSTDSSHLLHSPDLKRLSLNYIKAQPTRWAYSFLIEPESGESAAEVRQSIERTFEKQSLVEFAFRDPGSDSGDGKLVTPISLRSEEVTGLQESGKFRIVVTEV